MTERRRSAYVTRARDGLHEGDHEIVLTAKRHRTVGLAGQTDIGGAAKRGTALSKGAGIQINTALNVEDGFKTVTEIFSPAESPAASVQAIDRIDCQLTAADIDAMDYVFCIGVELEPLVQNPVQRHTALRVSRQRADARKGANQPYLFHFVFLIFIYKVFQ